MKILSNIIILGAKPIKGMRSLGAISNIPIYKKKSILDIQLQNLRKKFICDNIIYIGGHMGDKIDYKKYKNYNIQYINNSNFDSSNNSESLKLAMPYLKYNSTLIIFNKTLFNSKIFNKIAHTKTSSIYCDNSKYNSYKLGCTTHQDKITNIFYGLENTLCGIYYVANKEHEIMKYIVKNYETTNKFVFEIMNSIIDLGGVFAIDNIEPQNVLHADSNSNLKKITKLYEKYISN